MTRVLVRQPSPRLDEGLVTHIQRRPVDKDLALRQWESYVEALEAVGWDPIEVSAAPGFPDSAFVEDTVVVRGDRAVLTRPGAPERIGEVAGTAAAIALLGFEAEQIMAPATLDGGDVLQIADRLYVGVGGRTTLTACSQLADLLDIEVIPVPNRRTLHLKSAVTALPDGTVIGYPSLLDEIDAFETFAAVPEESGSHVVVLGPDSVLLAASAPRTAEMLRERGLAVVTVDISEFEKLEGCVTCLSVPVYPL